MKLSDPSMGTNEFSILDEAAEWMVRLQSGDMSAADRQALQLWRQRSEQHEAAWQCAESIFNTFGTVPSQVGQETLKRLQTSTRRDTLRLLGMAMVAMPASWLAWRQLPWREWSAGLRTATGAQKYVQLTDGTQLVLNTASAAEITITATERRLSLLAGEVLITTGYDPSPTYRPFVVQTSQGLVRALGTRFSVRQLDGSTQVAVYEHAVEIQPNAGSVARLSAGQQSMFNDVTVQIPGPADVAVIAWESGMLVARNMRLGNLVAEFGRYFNGILRCHPDVANLTVSGAFSLRDIDVSLQLLQKTLPVRVNAHTRFWQTVEPRR